MRRFCWRERSEKLNWRLLGGLDVAEVIRRGDPAVLEPYALHVTFARLPSARDPTTRDAWFLVRLLQLAMEYLLFIRARDGDVLEAISEELRQVERWGLERDELVTRTQKWKMKARTGEKQVEKLHQVLQNIAKLLQIHGASPSAVATIETLLTELILERRARQRKRALEKADDSGNDEDEMLRPAVQEARVCGYCGKLFSSAEYLEKHLVRRHTGERLALQTPIKRKINTWASADEQAVAVAGTQSGDPTASELAMQKMMQQVERALQSHEDTLRNLAKEETNKVQQVYEKLHAETQLADELKTTRLKHQQELANSQQELEEVEVKKQRAEEELADLKEQIQFLGLKKKMIGSVPGASLPTSIPRNDDQSAAAEEIKNLKQTLEMVNIELAASRVELAKLQSTHLALLKEKQEVADKLVKHSENPPALQHESSTQTEQFDMIEEGMQTDELDEPVQVAELIESPTPTCEDVGTDPVVVNFEDVGVQTVMVLALSVETEVQSIVADDPPVPAPLVHEEPEPHLSNTPLTNSASLVGEENAAEIIEHIHSSVEKDGESIPDYIQQMSVRDLLDLIMERANSAARKVVPRSGVSKTFSSISRHKFVRSHFQHDDSAVKERVSSCLQQLEKFSRRFGVPAKSAWLSNGNLKLVQQALYGHLEVLPSEVLTKMVDCENAVNATIEKEWMPMEKSRQEALERFKMETHAKSEVSQGLVHQAMAAFGAMFEPEQKGKSISVERAVVEGEGTSAAIEENSIDFVPEENQCQELASIDNTLYHPDPVPVRRYSANNKLTVVIEGEMVTGDTASTCNAVEHTDATTAVDSNPAVVFGLPESSISVHDPEMQDEVEIASPMDHADRSDTMVQGSEKDVHIESPTGHSTSIETPHREETQETVSNSAGAVTLESNSPKEQPTDQIGRKSADTLPDEDAIDKQQRANVSSSWNDNSVVSDSAGFDAVEPLTPAESETTMPHQDIVESDVSTEWHREQDQQVEKYSPGQLSQVDSEESAPLDHAEAAPTTLTLDVVEAINPLQSIGSFETDRLSAVSALSVSGRFARLDRTQSVVASSEMSFDSSIPSLGTDTVATDQSVRTAIMGLVELPDKRADDEAQHAPPDPSLDEQIEPSPTSNSNIPRVPVVEHDSVMSFDDSDIEEVVLS